MRLFSLELVTSPELLRKRFVGCSGKDRGGPGGRLAGGWRGQGGETREKMKGGLSKEI